MDMTRHDILNWLRENDPRRLDELWAIADETRRREVGDDVHLRGLIEFSNHCVRRCGYCGLRFENANIQRYRLTTSEIMTCVRQAVRFGYGTVVLQSGEDPGTTRNWLVDLIRRIKGETTLAVTLSVGERDDADLAAWREAGADRYLLRFETSNPALFQRIHPSLPGKPSDRLAMLRRLRQMGYEIGSGVMIGIPGQSYQDLAADIDLFRTLGLDMIGCGPFIPHPATPLGNGGAEQFIAAEEQVSADELTTYQVIALARLVCPQANIPATTALATLNRSSGRELGLMRGANVIMPNLTPVQYRAAYEIYPDKACVSETAGACQGCLGRRITAIGRRAGQGRGDSRSRSHRAGVKPIGTGNGGKRT